MIGPAGDTAGRCHLGDRDGVRKRRPRRPRCVRRANCCRYASVQPEGDLVHVGHRRRRAGVQQQRELGEAEVVAAGGADDAGQIRVLGPGGEDELGAVVHRGQLEDQQVAAPGPAEASRRLPDLDPTGQRRLVDGVLLHVPGPERQRDRRARRPLADDVARHPVPQLIGLGDRSPDAVDGVRVVAYVAQTRAFALADQLTASGGVGHPGDVRGLQVVSHRSPPSDPGDRRGRRVVAAQARR